MERAVRQKKPVPEIDFTLHTMDDNTTVSTQERVCKGEGLVDLTYGRLTYFRQTFKHLRRNRPATSNFGRPMITPSRIYSS